MLVLTLPISPFLAAAPLLAPEDPSYASPAAFEAPLRLLANGEPMGKDRLYPSPVLHDVDGDGQREMIIGDLFGHVLVAEKLAGDDPAAWSELEPLVTGDRPLKFSNW